MPFIPDVNSTPPGYQTPEQSRSVYGYGNALLENSTKDQPITSFWQGPERMAHALFGNIARNQAGKLDRASDVYDASRSAPKDPFVGGQPSVPAVNLSPSTTSGSFGTQTPPIRPPAPINASPPVANLQGSVPSGMPGGVPGGPGGMVSGMQPPNPMMQALMMQPPGQGMT